jgi:hypothetical protein
LKVLNKKWVGAKWVSWNALQLGQPATGAALLTDLEYLETDHWLTKPKILARRQLMDENEKKFHFDLI